MISNDLSRIASALERIADAVAGPKPNYAAAGLGGAAGRGLAPDLGMATKVHANAIRDAAHQFQNMHVAAQNQQGFNR